MRYLGIDYGEKRIGLAISDPDGRIAFPHSTVTDLAQVLAAIAKEGVERVVIGLPIPFKGGESEQGRRVREFAASLRSTVELPIEFENEVFTSRIAEETSRGEHADAAAAALILQSYLDRENSKS